jgi:hypothetical protein
MIRETNTIVMHHGVRGVRDDPGAFTVSGTVVQRVSLIILCVRGSLSF